MRLPTRAGAFGRKTSFASAPWIRARQSGNRFPMSVRPAPAKAAQATAMGAGHLGGGPRFIVEDQLLGGEVGLPFEPGLPPDNDVRPPPLYRVRGLFERDPMALQDHGFRTVASARSLGPLSWLSSSFEKNCHPRQMCERPFMLSQSGRVQRSPRHRSIQAATGSITEERACGSKRRL